MKCKKCGMDNPKDAAFCQFCYERFKGHSAADTYLKVMSRVREKERLNNSESPLFAEAGDAPVARSRSSIAWGALIKSAWRRISSFIIRYARPLGLLAGGLCLFLLIETALDPDLRFRWFGARLSYAFSAQTPVTYITGSVHEISRWSERAGQMDTPLGDLKIEEIGTVSVQPTAPDTANSPVSVKSRNWLINFYRAKGTESRLLPTDSPALAPSYFWIDRQGRVIRRKMGDSIRMAKSGSFLAPAFPKTHIRRNHPWTDTAEWSDTLDGWTFGWTVERRWQAIGLTDCGDGTCVRLVYDAWFKPRIVDQPAWMAGAIWTRAPVHGTGEVLFDLGRHQVVSHQVEYAATLRATISNLGQIPSSMRVGRRAFKTSGAIILKLKSRASLRRN